MTINPYQASPTTNDGPPEETPLSEVESSTRGLWIAFLFCPAIVPITFVLLLFLLGAIAVGLGININTASFLVLPLLAMTVGMVICYAAAGLIGMPVLLYLHRRKSLTRFSIYGVAVSLTLIASIILALLISISSGAPWYQTPLATLLVFGVNSPPVMISATVFWVVARRFGALSKT